jgi:hypothetical protein
MKTHAQAYSVVEVQGTCCDPPGDATPGARRLHGPGRAGASYDQVTRETFRGMLLDVEPRERAWVLFNNLPRAGGVKRFRALLGILLTIPPAVHS